MTDRFSSAAESDLIAAIHAARAQCKREDALAFALELERLRRAALTSEFMAVAA